MRDADLRSRPQLRRLPPSARTVARSKPVSPAGQTARAGFARTFADVLSRRFGGRWSVEWPETDDQRSAAKKC